MPSYQYTTLARLQTRLSSLGVSLRIDDNFPTAVADVINDASDEIEAYASFSYSTLSLSTNSWIAKKATDIALVYLCQRRNNPVPNSVMANYDKAISDLEAVLAGSRQIPGAARNKGAAPAISLPRIIQRPYNRVVIERMASRTAGATNPEGYVQHSDPTEWFDQDQQTV